MIYLSIYLSLENFGKELNYKNFKKRIDFPMLKDTIIFRPTGVLTSLGVEIFRITLCDRAHILKKATIYENDMTQYVFIFSTQVKCEE